MSNPKSTLNTFCQKHCKKVIGKEDIVYATEKFGDQYQATVTLMCLGGEQFAGELAPNAKQAEMNAAQAALTHHASEVAAVEAMPKVGGKRKAQDAGFNGGGSSPKVAKGAGKNKPAVGIAVVPGLIRPGETPKPAPVQPALGPKGEAVPAGPVVPMSVKTRLNSALGRILRRMLTKEDMICDTAEFEGQGFQTTITLPNLPGEWGGMTWAGELAPSLKESVESAAQQALNELEKDETFGPIIASLDKPSKKGKGAGGGAPGSPMQGWGSKGMGKAAMMGKMALMMEMFAAYGWGKGKGKGKKTRAGPKERIADETVTGTVVDWKGKFGFIEMEGSVEHEAASKNGGKVFLSVSDWSGESPPEVGTQVLFNICANDRGLAAENAQPVS